MAEKGNSEEDEKTEEYKALLRIGVNQRVAATLDSLYKDGIISHNELDARAIEALKELQADAALAVLQELKASNLRSVTNKSAYLCGIMKTYRQKQAAGMLLAADDPTDADRPGPDAEKLQEILKRTGYSHEVTMGQRKYGGPPPGWEGPHPASGFEVFCGKLPQTMFEDELIPMFEKCGALWDLRLMVDPVTGLNKSFCFVTFTEKSGAQKAVSEFDNYEIKQGRRLKVNISIANVRLFVGNLPKNRSKEELLEEFSKTVDGMTDLITYSNPNEPNHKNRGFAFLEFESHKSAATAKRRLGTTRVCGVDVVANWAEPLDEPDEEIMSKVKVLYVRNLKSEVTEDEVKEKFGEHGAIERVKKTKDFCFVHFESREDALKAMESLNGKFLGKSQMNITLAKPPSANKQAKKHQQQQRFGAAGRWSQPGGGRVRGGRVMRPPMHYANYGAAAYNPYNYGGYDDAAYDYSSYGYGHDDYYGYASFSPAAPYAVRSRGHIGLPMRRLRAFPGRRGQRGRLPRGVTGWSSRGGWRPPPPGSQTSAVGGSGQTQKGLKRKAPDDDETDYSEAKRVEFGEEEEAPWEEEEAEEEAWDAQPIVQQPLVDHDNETEWYQDSWS